ncbi:cupin domain-containing protein [Pseudonocardia adelaidensis]|uniref:Cupin type-2 domain-containing protein n=1 Tax=Pseudonocardia adelaidensis TaxID=648754 RepID=A0ABP9NGP9_9PSEU
MTGTEPNPASRIVTPVVTTPQTQRAIPFLGQAYRVRVSGQDTGDTFAVLDTEALRGHGSPMHLHRHDCETFLVLEGTLRLVVDGEEYEACAGCAAVLPAGRPHGFVVTSEAARYLTLHHGPAFERFAAAAGEGGATPDVSRLTEIAAAHGIDIIGPPPAPLAVRVDRGTSWPSRFTAPANSPDADRLTAVGG